MYTFDNDFLLFESNLSVIIYLSPKLSLFLGLKMARVLGFSITNSQRRQHKRIHMLLQDQ